jgi:hypothetical protein
LAAITAAVESKMPSTSSFMQSSQLLSRAIQKQWAANKGYPKKPNIYGDLLNITQCLTLTNDNKEFLVLHDTIVPNIPDPLA